jgi:Ca2+-binding EF-hand superfamily protein
MVAADAAGEGSLSEAALRVALETLGSPISAQEVHTLRTAFGNTDGSVDIARLLETLGVM